MKLKFYPEEDYIRQVARQNGWIVLVFLSPMLLVAGSLWFLEDPSYVRFFLGVIIGPALIATMGRIAIIWGKHNSTNVRKTGEKKEQ